VQLLEKKEGLFRRNMMGKRVNFSARSVISPDPYLQTNEIGIPDYIARALYYPEPVTSYNFKEMKKAVKNGTKFHPGADAVEDENGNIKRLKDLPRSQRKSLARLLLTYTENKGPDAIKRVYRHIR
jgi:DNA-directed RNA polymerase I subunit RPA1